MVVFENVYLHHHDMNLTIHNHYAFDDAKILDKLHLILTNQTKIMADIKDIQAQNDALITAVKDEDTVIDSAVALIQGFAATLQTLKDELAAALASNDPAASQAVVDSMGATITDINAKKQQLADAVTANTQG